MSVQRRQTFDLSTVTAGTPKIISLGGDVALKLVSVQAVQDTVSLAGVILKLVQSNDSTNWIDITDEKDKETTVISEAVDDVLYLESDFIGASQLGLSIDVAGVTTGNLEITFNSRSSI